MIPIGINHNSNLPITARAPSKPPKAKEPVSPIKIWAFGLLYLRKPINAPTTVAEIIATSDSPNKNPMIVQAKNENTPQDAASPSKPSVKL